MRRSQRRADEELADEKRRIVDSLAIFDALVLAMERSHEVLSLVEAAVDRDDTLAAVRQLLNVSEVQAMAVLDTQLWRFNRKDRVGIVEERDRLRALAEALPD